MKHLFKTAALALVLAALSAGPVLAETLDEMFARTDKLQREGKMTEALDASRSALAAAEKSGDELMVAKGLIDYGGALIAVGEMKPAEAPLKRGMEIRLARLGQNDPKALDAISQYAAWLTFTGRDAEAEPLLARAADGLEAAAKDVPARVTAAETRGGHAMVLLNLGRWAEGEAEMKRSLAMFSAPGLPTSSVQPAFMSVLSSAYLAWGRYEEARDLALATLAFREKYQGMTHPEIAGALDGLANALLSLGDAPGAEKHLRRALAITEAGYPAGSPYRAQAIQNLASFYASTNRPEEALALYARAVEVFETGAQVEWPMAEAYLLYAQARLKYADPAGARPLAVRAVELSYKSLGPDNEKTGLSEVVLAQVLTRLGETAAAEEHAGKALAIYEKALTPENPRRADVLVLLGRAADSRGEPAKAEGLYEQAVAAMAKARAPRNEALIEARVLLARQLLGADGSPGKAYAAVRPAADALRDKVLADSRLAGRGGETALAASQREVFVTAIDAAWASDRSNP